MNSKFYEYLLIFHFWYCELCFTDGLGRGYESGGAESFILFCFLGCSNCRWVRCGGVGQKVLCRTDWNHMFLFIQGYEGEFKISLRDPRGGKIFLRSLPGGGGLGCQLVFLWFINFSFCYVFFLLFFSYLSLNIPVWCSWFLVIWFWRGFNSFSVTNLFFSICSILV